MDLRPREERDLSEFYDNLEETTPLTVFVLKHSSSRSPCVLHKEPNPNPTLTTTSKLYTLNTVLRDYRSISKENGRVEKPGKINKALLDYGYRSNVRPKITADQCYTRFQPVIPLQPLLKYDLDEQDALYLEWLNLRQENLKITAEVFEITMSILEYEWHKLEQRMIALVGPGHDGRDDLKLDANFDRYGSDDGTGGVDSLSEQRCAVCNDLECDNTNSIVYCDGCNIAVHQECYGVAFIPEGQWFCRRCMVNRGSPVTCAFCPSKTGAFKQLDNGMWSHVVCALWIREVYFANPVYLEPIEGVAAIPRSRWTLVCYICKQKVGACIQCVHRKCTQAYHVTCAKRAGLYMAMEKGVLGAVSSNDTLKSYCDKHCPSHMDKGAALSGIIKTRMFYKDVHSLSRKNDRLASERRQANRVNRFKWRTENGTPIAPQVFVNVVVATMKSLKIGDEVGPERMLRGLGGLEDTSSNTTKLKEKESNLKSLGAALCKYWCLKREAKNGAPLVRIRATDHEISSPEPATPDNHTETENVHINHDEDGEIILQMPNKIDFGHGLENDLKKLIEMNSLAVERQRLITAQSEETFKMTETAYFGFRATAKEVMQKMIQILLNNRDRKSGEIESLNCDIQHVASDISEGIIWSALDANHRIQRGFEERNYSSTQGNVAKALRFWNEIGLPELESAEKNVSTCIPFTEIDGLEYSLKHHDPRAVLESEDLSEVEDDPFLQQANREALRKFVSK